MTFPTTTGNSRSRSVLAAAFTAAVCLLAVLSSNASAAFTISPCDGSDVIGRGASFQAQAHVAFESVFIAQLMPNGCNDAPFSTPDITYQADGSGAGRSAFGGNATGARDATVRFAATDEAPTALQRTTMEAGVVANPNDNGVLHVVPVAQGATTLFVNFPSSCQLPSGASNVTTYARGLITNSQLENVLAADPSIDTWGELYPNIEAAPGGTRTTTQCQGRPIIRVVRKDNSGTTFSLKQYMKAVNPLRTWEEPTLANSAWPNNVAPTAVIRATANGNGPLAQLAKVTDGSIGYGDLASARANGFRKYKTAGVYTFQAGNYWIPLNNKADDTGTYQEPTRDIDSILNGKHGANCGNARHYITGTTNLPTGPGGDPTLGDWSQVSGVFSGTGYPLCALTYMLVWDDNADVYGSDPAEEASARTVKDYLGTAVLAPGQSSLQASDYYKLPSATANNIKQVAINAHTAVDWLK